MVVFATTKQNACIELTFQGCYVNGRNIECQFIPTAIRIVQKIKAKDQKSIFFEQGNFSILALQLQILNLSLQLLHFYVIPFFPHGQKLLFWLRNISF